MKVQIVDPPAYTPPYDHALCAALAELGLDVELITSPFAYGSVPEPAGYVRRELFRRSGSATARALRLAEHVPAMLRYRRLATTADIVHFQWLTLPAVDRLLLPRGRPLVITAHDILPRERIAGSHAAQRRLYQDFDAVIAHSQAGRERLIDDAGLDPEKVHVIPHGAFSHLAAISPDRLPAELDSAAGRRVVLYFGLIRPYKGLDVLLEAWPGIDDDAELWIVGRPRFEINNLRSDDPSVRWVPRFVSDEELAACFRRADLVVLPYREIEQSGVLATALAFGSPVLASDVGGFREIAQAGAAKLVAPGDAAALHEAIIELLDDEPARRSLSDAALALTAGPLSWQSVAEQTRALYASLS